MKKDLDKQIRELDIQIQLLKKKKELLEFERKLRQEKDNNAQPDDLRISKTT